MNVGCSQSGPRAVLRIHVVDRDHDVVCWIARESMKIGTIEFEGSEYPDGNASNPVSLGLMQGSPPPSAKLRSGWKTTTFWAFRKSAGACRTCANCVTTAAVWHGAGPGQ